MFYKFCFSLISLSIIFTFAVQINAQLDTSFGTNGVVSTDTSGDDVPLETFVLPDGKILIVSSSSNPPGGYNYFFVRYNADGSLDSTYGNGGKVQLPIPFTANDRYFTKVLRQPDGKIILVGRNNNDGLVVRLNENGTLDPTFSGDGIHRPNISINFPDGINSAVLQADGKLLVAGYATDFGVIRLFLLRYNTNGSVDSTFGTTEGYTLFDNIRGQNSLGTYLFLQSSGKFIIVNPFEDSIYPNGSIRRFNADGTLDGTFATSQFPGNQFRIAAIQPDDKILLASVINKTETLERSHIDTLISRYNANGGIDTSFGTNGQASFDITSFFDDNPIAVKVLPDNQIVVAVSTYVNANRSRFRSYTLALAKLSPNGAVNGKFLQTSSFPSAQNGSIAIQPDGKILTAYGTYNTTINNSDILLTRAVGVPLQTYRLRGVPFDFQAFDGKAEPTLFRPSDRKWYIYPTFPGYFFGLADDVPVPSDYISDFSTELAVFRPSNGTWYIAKNFGNPATNYITIQWGLNGDIPQPNDFDGDGKSDVAVFRPSNGVWYIRNSADNSFKFVAWGTNGDKPASGDFDGDGIIDIAVFRPSDGNWYIVKSSDGQYIITHFGLNGDIPVQEDYDGDGKTDIAVYRPSEGIWYRLNSSDGSFYAAAWGAPADIPVPADYDGDLKTDIATWRQANGRWYVFQSSDNALSLFNWGVLSDIPIQRRF